MIVLTHKRTHPHSRPAVNLAEASASAIAMTDTLFNYIDRESYSIWLSDDRQRANVTLNVLGLKVVLELDWNKELLHPDAVLSVNDGTAASPAELQAVARRMFRGRLLVDGSERGWARVALMEEQDGTFIT